MAGPLFGLGGLLLVWGSEQVAGSGARFWGDGAGRVAMAVAIGLASLAPMLAVVGAISSALARRGPAARLARWGLGLSLLAPLTWLLAWALVLGGGLASFRGTKI